MIDYCRRGTGVLVLVACAAATAWAQQTTPVGTTGTSGTIDNREQNLRAYIELLRSDLRTSKIAVLTEVLQFTDQEDAVFWPLYRQYELDVSRLNDDRIALVETYAKVYEQLTDAAAHDLVVRFLDLEARQTALKQQYYATLAKAMSARTAARVIQVENQIQLLVSLQIAASLPVAVDAPGGAR